MRVGLFASSWAFGVLLLGAPALAQPKPPNGAASRSSAQFTMRREDPGGPAAAAARARARAGDCAGALSSFDVAIEKTFEPTLRRDRGLCHEKLGNVFPAIDDYRAYLTAQPDAPDADQIRQRLATLEEQSGGPSSRPSTKDDGDKGAAGGEAKASVSIGKGGARVSSSASERGPVLEPTDPGLSY
ncbi:MAG TPA: tetratricopeptide repeat protein, partial [Labilithrix sp.]|nr:tetratricopeptide repeat protein [Labilithrix sp.]